MVETNTREKLTGALHAKVSEVLFIREDDHLEVWLTITAENRTNETINLNENYDIPMSDASNIKVVDLTNQERLTGFYNQRRRRLEVVFKEGRRLSPGEKFCWSVKYKTSRFGVMTSKDQMITAVFALVPRKSYKHVSIETHDVKLRAVFLRSRQGDAYKDLSVLQSNSHNISAQITEKEDRVVCTYQPFVLVKGSKLRVTFNYQYRMSAPIVCDKPKEASRLKRYAGAASSVALQTLPGVLTAAVKPILDWILRNKV